MFTGSQLARLLQVPNGLFNYHVRNNTGKYTPDLDKYLKFSRYSMKRVYEIVLQEIEEEKEKRALSDKKIEDLEQWIEDNKFKTEV